MITETESQKLRFTHWKETTKDERLFLVVDVPTPTFNTVILMEVKEYKPDDERYFKVIDYIDWVIFTVDKNLLKQVTPKVEKYKD